MLFFMKFAGASKKMEIVRLNVLANFIKLTHIQNRTLHYTTLGFMPGDHFNPNRILSGVFVLLAVRTGPKISLPYVDFYSLVRFLCIYR